MATATEYGLIAVLVSVAAIAVLGNTGHSLESVFGTETSVASDTKGKERVRGSGVIVKMLEIDDPNPNIREKFVNAVIQTDPGHRQKKMYSYVIAIMPRSAECLKKDARVTIGYAPFADRYLTIEREPVRPDRAPLAFCDKPTTEETPE